MCNLAGYIGQRPAAPILLEMMARQEGFAGGYYSGVATIAGGQMHHAKCVGDFAQLRASTAVEALPGTVGIAHSRSKSGGDVEWGHPFVDCQGRLAYVANGSRGLLDNPARQAEVVRQLEAAGHRFRARDKTIHYAGGPTLASGEGLHLSEVMAHLAESFVAAHGPAEALRLAYQTYPGEVVGLLVSADLPDAVAACRINQPLMIGHGDGEIFLATTALAFPAGAVRQIYPLPPTTAAVIYADRVEIRPLNPAPADLDVRLPWGEGYTAIRALLSDGQPRGLGDLKSAVAPLWPEGTITQRDLLSYETLRCLHADGLIDFEVIRVPGATPDLTAPRIRARWCAEVPDPEPVGATVG